MKRSEVPGATLLCKSPPEINNETMKREGKSVMNEPTKVNLVPMKRIKVPGVAFGELRKSPPEVKVKDETMKREGRSVMNEPTKETDETVVDSSADRLEPLSCGVQTFSQV
jgi:hypothetical protein